ncbi:MAG TPA: hypothetical protein VL614_12650 [Acetobacteraceae bacterium]|jgi:hypothetical protein|nr:hypothetical protein [Acetobacteraceae bacterium]
MTVLFGAVEGHSLDARIIGDMPLAFGGSAAFELPSPGGIIDIVGCFAAELPKESVSMRSKPA